jgi:hypothetical protein
MTTTKTAEHTPGPWTVNEGGIQGPNSTPICWGYHEDFGALIFPILPANARLIAAAPDLLEALKILAARIDEGMHGFSETLFKHGGDPGLLKLANQAITKATGR